MAELVEHYRSVMTADKKRIAAEVAS